MKLKTYSQFINESKNYIKFSYIYNFNFDWWAIWYERNKDKYSIIQNAIDKTFTIIDKKSEDLVFVYDYNKEALFTDKKSEFFDLPDTVNISVDKLEKEKEKVEKKTDKPEEREEKKEEKKELEA